MKITIAIPAYNEEIILKNNILILYNFLKNNISDDWKIVITDNNSSDRTGEIGKDLEKEYLKIKYLFVSRKGKGLAIRTAWENSDVDVCCFMDADLATDLSALPALISAISKNNYDIAAGSRFLPESKVERSLIRKFVSQNYRLALHWLLGLKIKDAPCGFKAVNRKVIKNILPKIKNNTWFFDTEMVFLAEKENYRVKEIPVSWTEHKKIGRKSRVNFIKVSLEYLKEIWRLKKTYAGN